MEEIYITIINVSIKFQRYKLTHKLKHRLRGLLHLASIFDTNDLVELLSKRKRRFAKGGRN